MSGLFPILWKWVCVEEADDILQERDRLTQTHKYVLSISLWHQAKIILYLNQSCRAKSHPDSPEMLPLRSTAYFHGRLQVFPSLQVQPREWKTDSLLKAN